MKPNIGRNVEMAKNSAIGRPTNFKFQILIESEFHWAFYINTSENTKN